MKILFLVPYPLGQAPSQRFRFEQYFSFLTQNEIAFETQSFLSQKTWKILYKKGFFAQKIVGILAGFARRLLILFSLHKFDFVFIHREASPIFPPIFELVIAKIFQKKIIYDFDDAIWLPNTSSQNSLVAFLKFNQKVPLICRWAYKISCGNEYLCNFARQFNQNVFYNPTTIDLNLHDQQKKHEAKKEIVIGWTGTHSTLKYLQEIVPIIQKLSKKYSIQFVVIANQKPDFQLDSLNFIFWTKENEIQDLLKFDIGIMPLSADRWSDGKCGFKALQYMALGIPTLASPVGVNEKIIQNGENGFLCKNEAEWEQKLTLLIENHVLRTKIGSKAKQTVEKYYSVDSNEKNFLNFFV